MNKGACETSHKGMGMPSLQETLQAKVQEAERLVAQIKTLPQESEEGKDTIRR